MVCLLRVSTTSIDRTQASNRIPAFCSVTEELLNPLRACPTRIADVFYRRRCRCRCCRPHGMSSPPPALKKGGGFSAPILFTRNALDLLDLRDLLRGIASRAIFVEIELEWLTCWQYVRLRGSHGCRQCVQGCSPVQLFRQCQWESKENCSRSPCDCSR